MSAIYFLVSLTILNMSCEEATATKSSIDEGTATAVNLVDRETSDTFLGSAASEIGIQPDTSLSYQQVKKQIEKLRTDLARQDLTADTVGLLFTDWLVKKIIPYWYGTKWSFEGHTAIPSSGTIACGYFVSTTLKDMGLVVNRYRLAQQSPINEAKSINLSNAVVEVSEGSIEGNIEKLTKLTREGIYFIGLDQNHVGFLLHQTGSLFFIHSNYLQAKGVELERIEDSSVFSFYDRFYLAEISTNERLMEKWLNQDEIEVLTR